MLHHLAVRRGARRPRGCRFRASNRSRWCRRSVPLGRGASAGRSASRRPCGGTTPLPRSSTSIRSSSSPAMMRTDTSGAPECFAALARASATIAFAVSRVTSGIRSTSPSIETRADRCQRSTRSLTNVASGGLAVRCSAVELEQDLADLLQVVPDRILDLFQGRADELRLRADPVLQALELEDRARDGLGEPVMDVDRPIRALLQQQRIDRMGHGRMHAPSGAQRRARSSHSHPFDGGVGRSGPLGLVHPSDEKASGLNARKQVARRGLPPEARRSVGPSTGQPRKPSRWGGRKVANTTLRFYR